MNKFIEFVTDCLLVLLLILLVVFTGTLTVFLFRVGIQTLIHSFAECFNVK